MSRRGEIIAFAIAVGVIASLAAVGWALAKPVNHPVAMPEADGFIPVALHGTHGSLLRTSYTNRRSRPSPSPRRPTVVAGGQALGGAAGFP